MTKTEIKAALDLAGITYAKKANLATLVKTYNANCVAEDEPFLNEDGSVAAKPDAGDIAINALVTEIRHPEMPAPLESLGLYGLGTGDEDAVCPHCGINHMHNGHQTADGYEGAQHEFICLGCGGEWGPAVAPTAAPTGTGLKIEKDRLEQNGIKRPSIGGKCRAIWDALDAYRAETGELPTSKTVKELAADEGWNPNNASIEYYQWRKFNGIAKGA